MIARILSGALIALALGGCGLKDDLYLPAPDAGGEAPASSPAEPPAGSAIFPGSADEESAQEDGTKRP
jgi:predicted small lipoprotein YifL